VLVVRDVTTGRLPLDFISCVQKWTSSWISSGATSLRDHAFSQRGLGAASSELGSAFELLREASFDLKTFLKKGMLGGRRSLHVFGRAAGSKVPVRVRVPVRARRWEARVVSVQRADAGTRKGYAQAERQDRAERGEGTWWGSSGLQGKC
jgi:hypothetical protein